MKKLRRGSAKCNKLRNGKSEKQQKKIVRAANLSPSPTLTGIFLLLPLSNFKFDFSTVKVFVLV